MIDIGLLGMAASAVNSELPQGAVVRFQAKDSTGYHSGQITNLPASIGGVTLTQTDSAKQPYQKTDATNKQEYLQFTKSAKTSLDAEAIKVDTWAGTTGKTMTTLLIFRERTAAGGAKHFNWIKKVGSTWDQSSLINIYSPFSDNKVYYDTGATSGGRVKTDSAVSNPVGHVNAYLLERNGTGGKVYQNGVQLATSSNTLTATLLGGSPGTARLGGHADNDTKFVDMDFFEMVIYPRVLTDAEKISVSDYTKKVYGA